MLDQGILYSRDATTLAISLVGVRKKVKTDGHRNGDRLF
jgi:hypothetical protein